MPRLLLLFAALAAGPLAAAQTLNVSTTNDLLGGDTSSASNLIATPGPDGLISLREAIIAANNTGGAGNVTINLASGATYVPSFLFTPFDIITRSNVTIAGDGTPVINGNTLFAGLRVSAASSFQIDGVRFASCISGLDISGTNGVTITGCSFGGPGTANFTDLTLTGASNGVVGGASAAASNTFIYGLAAINLNACTDIQVRNNYVGTDSAGSPGLGGGAGLLLTNSTTGCTVSGNTFAGCAPGISITLSSRLNVFDGNYIGVAPDGVTPLGNTIGIEIDLGAQDNTIGGPGPGQPNIIAHNDAGVLIDGGASNNNVVSANSIFANDDGNAGTPDGIRLTNGGNGGAVAPTVTAASSNLTGTGAQPSSTIEIFVDDADQGEVYIGQTTAGPTGNFSAAGFNPGPYEGRNVTVTNLASTGTSPFSAPFAIPSTAPTVALISLDQGPVPTNAPVLSYTIEFSEAITGFDTALNSNDFELVDTTGGAQVIGASGSGDTFNVQIMPGPGDGTVALRILGTGGIQDLAGNALAGAPVDSGAFEVQHLRLLTQPVSGINAIAGGDAAIGVTATGPNPIVYQWFRNTGSGFVPFGPGTSTLNLLGVIEADEGSYYVAIQDVNEGPIDSTLCILTVAAQMPAHSPLALAVLAAALAALAARRRK